VCVIPREQLRTADLATQIDVEGVTVERSRLGAAPWLLEPKGVFDLLEKIRDRGVPLIDFARVRPLSGIKTGFNDAFLIDSRTKTALLEADPNAHGIIRRYLRGQDIARWHADWAGLWMLALKSSGDHSWPWAEAGEDAENVFRLTYPSIYSHVKPLEDQLRKRQDHGRYWWELRSCAYWQTFDRPKIIYQDITWQPSFNLDTEATLSNNTVYFLPTDDLWTLAALNSPAAWAFAWRKAQHGKDEALRFFSTFIESFPVPTPTDDQRSACEPAVRRLIEISQNQQQLIRDLLNWIAVEHGIEKPSMRLQSPLALDAEGLIAEVKKLRGKKRSMSLAGLRSLREEHDRTIAPAQAIAREGRIVEQRVATLIDEAYGLTAEEVRLIWETAPPRMPLADRR
jgi:hypothetical protein